MNTTTTTTQRVAHITLNRGAGYYFSGDTSPDQWDSFFTLAEFVAFIRANRERFTVDATVMVERQDGGFALRTLSEIA